MLPPRDYPEISPPAGAPNAQAPNTQGHDADRVTVRRVLDRNESAQPVTDAMIHTAVTNLYSVDEDLDSANPSSSTQNAPNLQPRVPVAIRSLLRNVLPD